MPIYGTCKKCGTETINYCCGACDAREAEDLNEKLEAALKAQRAAEAYAAQAYQRIKEAVGMAERGSFYGENLARARAEAKRLGIES